MTCGVPDAVFWMEREAREATLIFYEREEKAEDF